MDCHVWLRLGRDLPQGEADALRHQFSNVKFSADPKPEDFPSIQVVFTNSRLADEQAAQLPALKWIHTTYGGGLNYLTPSVVTRDILVTSSRGVQAEPLSEFTEACVLALGKKFPSLWQAKQERHWDEAVRPDTVAGKVALLLGLGAVGSAVAQRLQKQGMSVRAIRRKIHDVPPYVDAVYGMDRLPDLLRDCDVLVISLPGSDAMRGLIGERELQSMKTTSYLVNLVTREIVPDAALFRALQNGWIAGAACNAFEINPLPDESPLWDAPNLIISPGVASADPQRWQKLAKVFSGNLGRYLAGQPLANIVRETDG